MVLDAAYTCHMSEESFRMSSHRPYLLRALVEWINDNGMTPHIMVDAGVPGVQVPASAVKDERVVLNIAERAVMRLHIDNDAVSFTARRSPRCWRSMPAKPGRAWHCPTTSRAPMVRSRMTTIRRRPRRRIHRNPRASARSCGS